MARGKKAAQGLTPEEKLAQALVPVEEQPYQIPENWCWIHLPEAFTNHTDSKKKIQSKAYLSDGKYSVVDQGQELIGGYTDDKDMLYSGKLPVIIFGDHTRCVKLIDFPFAQGADGVKVLRPKDFYDINAFYYSLQAVNIPNLGYRRHFPLFSQFAIPLPPLNEQRRIVDRIESIFAKLDEAKEKAQAVVDGFGLRKSAILHKAFTGELTAKWRKLHGLDLKSWEYLKIGEFAQVKGGKRLPKGCSLVTQKTNHPYLRIADFGDNTIDKTDLHYITEDVFEQIRSYIIKKEDVYLSIVGTIGKAGVIPEELDGANLTENAARIITNRTQPRYLCLFLSSPQTQENIKNRIRSATLGKLSLLNIKDIDTPLPTVEEQLEIVRIINDLFEKESAAKEAAEAVLEQIDTMKKAVLARAFRGELGTNDPTEASAVELLKTML